MCLKELLSLLKISLDALILAPKGNKGVTTV